MSDAPPRRSPGRLRWTAQRKATLVFEVRTDKRNVEDVYREYGVTAREIVTWSEAFDRFGLEGLKVTKINRDRGPRPAAIKLKPDGGGS